jgi:hypothetical protein
MMELTGAISSGTPLHAPRGWVRRDGPWEQLQSMGNAGHQFGRSFDPSLAPLLAMDQKGDGFETIFEKVQSAVRVFKWDSIARAIGGSLDRPARAAPQLVLLRN